jgi:hypothetical protein
MVSRANICYIKHNWLTHLRDFLWEIHGRIEIQNSWSPKPQREHDQYIIKSFTALQLSRAELMVLNKWRLYYQVLSELCVSKGKEIQPHFLVYDHGMQPRQSSSNLNWPIQYKPDKASFNLWMQCIQACYINLFNKKISNLDHWDLGEVLCNLIEAIVFLCEQHPDIPCDAQQLINKD